jgi:hypothetical protein
MPVITNLQPAAALVNAPKHKSENGHSIRSLHKYMDDLPWKMWQFEGGFSGIFSSGFFCLCFGLVFGLGLAPFAG